MKNGTKTANLQQHEIGKILPAISPKDFKNLVKGMKKSGFDPRHKITLYEGKVLDGWSRYQASNKTGVEPVFDEYKGDNPYEFVFQENLGRRNLTPSQAAIAASELMERMQAQERTNRIDGKNGEKIKGSKAAHAAKVFNVSERNVATARKVKKANPKLAEAVKSRKITLHAASKQVEKEENAKNQKSDEFVKSLDRLERLVSKEFATTAKKKLTSKEVIKMSDLEPDEIRRIAPFIEDGWTLKLALGYKATSLTYAHSLRQLRDRALAQGGKFFVEMSDGWKLSAERVK